MDGRNARKARTREAILLAARAAMRAGVFRPTVKDIAAAAGFSVRSVFEHFGTQGAVYREALDAETFSHVLAQISPNAAMWAGSDHYRVVHAAVYGRVRQE